MQRDEEANTINHDGDRVAVKKSSPYLVVASMIVAATIFIAVAVSSSPKQGSALQESFAYGKQHQDLEGTILQSEIIIDEVFGGVIGDIYNDHQPVFDLGSISYHPEKKSDIYESTFDEQDPYNPWENNTDPIFTLENDVLVEAAIAKSLAQPEGNRNLETTYPVPDYLYPLPCNDGLEAADCTTTTLSSLVVPANSPLVIECGVCVAVDASDGQDLILPKGLRIEGKLYFPESASITIHTPFVHVLGILKMDNPSLGNLVKIRLTNGNEEDEYFLADSSQQVSDTDACEGNGCRVGKKAIAVVGGQLDIHGFDPDCPSWEHPINIFQAETPAPTASPQASGSVDLPPICLENLFENGDWKGYATVTETHEDVVIPGNTAVEVGGRPTWGFGMYERFEADCFRNDQGGQWKFEMDVRLLDEVTREGLDCDPASNGYGCPFVRFQSNMPDGSYPWYYYFDQDMDWNKDGWSRFSVVFDTPQDWSTANWLQAIICGGPNNSILVVDNVSLERFDGSTSVTAPISMNNDPDEYNKIQLSQKAAECWMPGSEILITSNNEDWTAHQLATIESTDPASGTITLTSNIDPVSTLTSHPDYAVEIALLNRRIVFEAEDDEDDDLMGGHLIVFKTPNVIQHLEGVEIRNFGQQGNLGRYPVHFHLCDSVFGSIVKKNVVRQSNQRCYVMHGSNGAIIEDNVAFDAFGHCYMTEDGVEHSNHFIRNLGAAIHKVDRLLHVFGKSKREETDDEPAVFWMTNMENYFEGNVAASSARHGFWIETHFTMEGRGGSIYQRPDHEPIKSVLGSFKDNVAHSFRNFGLTNYPPGWTPTEMAVIENFKAYRSWSEGIFLHNQINMTISGGKLAQLGMIGLRSFAADDIIVDGTEFIGNIEGDNELCTAHRHAAISISPHRSPTHHMLGEHYGVKLYNAKFSRWFDRDDCLDSPLEISTIQLMWPGWDTYNLLDNFEYDNSHPVFATACEYEEEIDGDAAIEISGSTIYGGPGYLVGSVNVPLAGTECTDVEGCLYFCPDACLRTIKFKTSSARGDVHNYVMKVSNGATTTTVNRWYTLWAANRDHIDMDYHEVSTFSISLPDGDFTVWFEDQNVPGVVVYPNFVLPYFEPEPSCSGFATQDSITILKPPADEPRCDNLIKNGDFASGIDEWQEFGAKSVFHESAGVYGTGALVNNVTWDHALVTQWLDASCLVDNAGVYVFQLSYRVVDAIDDVASANNIDNLVKEPAFYLKFDNWDEEAQDLVSGPSSWPEEIIPPTLPPTMSPTTPVITLPELEILGNNGHPSNLFPLQNCAGDCDSDAECQAGLVCFQRNGHEPVPGCSGRGNGGTDYCYDPNAPPHEPSTELESLGNNGAPGWVYPLAKCKGQCRSDADCQAGLVCMDRIADEPVPGCSGTGSRGSNYCYNPDDYVEPIPTENPESIPSPTDFTTVSKTFTISPEQAAMSNIRIILFNFNSTIILDNISLTKAECLGSNDPLCEQQALEVMNHIVGVMQALLESSIALPLSVSDLTQLFQEFASDVRAYVESTFPGGVLALSFHDGNLPEGLPSLETYLSTVLPALEEQYIEANANASEDALRVAETEWEVSVKNTIDAAIDQAIADLIDGLDEEVPFPFLDEGAFQSFQDKLASIAEAKGESRINNCEA